MKVYIAGPMSGLPQHNFPAFDAAAADLRSRGFEVISPAELDDPEDRVKALASPDGSLGNDRFDKTWGDFLARDVKLLADDNIEAIFVLPGWMDSRGARLETFVGNALQGMPVFAYGVIDLDGQPVRVPYPVLVEAWAGVDLSFLVVAA